MKVVVKEFQLPMLVVLRHIHSETQKHVRVFPSAEGYKTSHIADGTYSKSITIPFISDANAEWFTLISDALDSCCGDVC